MPATYNLLPANAVKFRENSADSVVYNLEGHSPELPKTMTITRVLPSPRKGNAGTLKVLINVRNTIILSTPEGDKRVPVITKYETSMPVGAPLVDILWNKEQMGFLTNYHTDVDTGETLGFLFKDGNLLDGSGTLLEPL